MQVHFLDQAACSGIGHVFVGARMSAAGVGPQPGRVIFIQGTLLEQHAAIAIPNDNGKRPMQRA
jgi:hypothetical protein